MDNEEKFRQYVLLFIFLGLCYVFFSIFYRDTSEIDNQKLVIRTNVVSPTPVEDPFAKNNEITCLAKNMYFEARSEGIAGVVATTQVVYNRVDSEEYPNTICEVIEQAKISQWWLKEKGVIKPIKNKCQFSWFCDGYSDEPKDDKTYSELFELAEEFVNGDHKNMIDITGGALWYHADYVHPRWANSKEVTAKVGRHIFYK
tara:strand:- start:1325 stop:1927 length:603 start_codon:yes stop_codon:yes gene_type:complete